MLESGHNQLASVSSDVSMVLMTKKQGALLLNQKWYQHNGIPLEGILTKREALYKVGSDFSDGIYENCDCEVIQTACLKCHAPILCAYADMAQSDFADTYNHICMNIDCDYMARRTIFGMTMGTRDSYGPERCPFCMRDV